MLKLSKRVLSVLVKIISAISALSAGNIINKKSSGMLLPLLMMHQDTHDVTPIAVNIAASKFIAV